LPKKSTTRPASKSPSKTAAGNLLRWSRYRAKKAGIPFDITVDDIHVPKWCPALGLKLGPNPHGPWPHKASASLDRIDPKKGYVKGNVIVLSHLANNIKSTATPDQLEAVAAFVRQLRK
jgi:hypothetical protein